MMAYTAKEYEVLFTEPIGEEAIEGLRHKQVALQKTRTVWAGDMVYVDSYPVWNTKAEAGKAKKAKEQQREAQQALNERNRKKYIEQMANANFTKEDLFATFTYAGQAPDEKQALRDMQNLVRRIKSWCAKNGKPAPKYIYVIEFEDTRGKRKRIHQHMLISGIDRDALEALWPHGRANTRRLQPNGYGLAEIVAYMLKAKRSTRRCTCSRNLTKPKGTTSERRMSKRKVERLAEGLTGCAGEVFERVYPGYELVDYEVARSEYVAGAYIRARMRRRDGKRDGKEIRNQGEYIRAG